jgi:hypothetical protein
MGVVDTEAAVLVVSAAVDMVVDMVEAAVDTVGVAMEAVLVVSEEVDMEAVLAVLEEADMEAVLEEVDMEADKAMEKVFRSLGFGDSDLKYEEIDGEQRLFISGKVLDYVTSHKKSMRREFERASKAAAIKAVDTAGAIIEMQKTGRKYG